MTLGQYRILFVHYEPDIVKITSVMLQSCEFEAEYSIATDFTEVKESV